MPSGVHLSIQIREVMYRMAVAHKFSPDSLSPEDIHLILFGGLEAVASLDYIKRKVSMFINPLTKTDDISKYLAGSNIKGGRPSNFSAADDILLNNLATHISRYRLWHIRNIFIGISGYDSHVPSLSSIFRSLKRSGISLKVATRQCLLQSAEKQRIHMEIMSPFLTEDIINIDETNLNNSKLQERYARSPIGERAVVWEWSIQDPACSSS